MLNKVVDSLAAAIAGVGDGASVLVGGFGGAGMPEGLLAALMASGARRLTLIANAAGRDESVMGQLMKQDRVAKIVCSFPQASGSTIFRECFLAGRFELEIVPQGILAERIRAGGAGIEAFYTPVGVGTEVAEGKRVEVFDGRACVLERAIRADFAFVRARAGDRWGNLVYDRAARNFNPPMAMAGKVTVAEVEEIVPAGDLDPDHVHLPGVFVQRIIKGSFEKRIEQRTVRKREHT